MAQSFSEVAVLFARRDSIYKTLPACDVWDAQRDARLWPGGAPAIAHPPCRTWGRLRYFAKPPDLAEEQALSFFAVTQVQRWGGVLEHPAGSLLWKAAGLPRPGHRDEFGWTLFIQQWWFGHRAEKATWIYVVGVEPSVMPPLPFRLGDPTYVIQSRKKHGEGRPHVSRAEREATPLRLAQWLVEVARMAV